MIVMKIELVIVRDPDGGTDVDVFVDGEPVGGGTVVEYVIDAGAGYEWSDWAENRDADLAEASSDAVRKALRGAYVDPPGRQYIEGKPEGAGWLDAYEDDDAEVTS